MQVRVSGIAFICFSVILSFLMNSSLAFIRHNTHVLRPRYSKLLLGRMSSGGAEKSTNLIRPPDGFTPPTPKPLSIADGNYKGFLTGALAAAARLGTGVFVLGWRPKNNQGGPWPGTLGIFRDGSAALSQCTRPSIPPVIYEYEASPFCRKVREACVLLDIPVQYKPCPGARTGYSDELFQRTGRRTVPYMIDPNTKTEMFESDDIIEYLFETYGPGKNAIPWTLKGDFAVNSCVYATQVRGYAGSRLLPNIRKDVEVSGPKLASTNKNVPAVKPLVLWGYEGSPFVRPVRETLCSLGLSHVMINCGRGSSNRDKLYEKTGRFQVPFLEDPNTGIEMFESSDIVKYLLDTYTVS